MAGTLYLIPTPLGDTPLDLVLPEETRRIAARLTHFVVEHAKTARAFLKQVGTEVPLQQLDLAELNEHTRDNVLEALLAPLLAGHDVGLLSEAGCPAVADPGTDLVRLAHRHGIRVRPLVGPSSILLALMASGLVGQRFTFHGYLPAK
ncbi:MAG: SAM-dependent methyltransferase, partial [Gallionellaceae bacterium]|nr:SAM-dependent methyltransferase [Gallionellaceae bacterium]